MPQSKNKRKSNVKKSEKYKADDIIPIPEIKPFRLNTNNRKSDKQTDNIRKNDLESCESLTEIPELDELGSLIMKHKKNSEISLLLSPSEFLKTLNMDPENNKCLSEIEICAHGSVKDISSQIQKNPDINALKTEDKELVDKNDVEIHQKAEKYSQCSIFKNFKSPLDFIITYSQIYNLQKDKKRKILFSTLKTREDFEVSYLNLLHKQNLDDYSQIEKKLLEMREFEYYDNFFYEYVKKLYLKTVLIIIDRSDTNISDMLTKRKITDITQFLDNVMIFYRFTDLNIDINLLFLERITRNFDIYLQNPSGLLDKVLEYQKILDKLNDRLKELEISAFVFDPELRSKIDLSLNIQGFERRNCYDSDFVIHFINELKIHILHLDKTTAYLHVMNIKNEMDRRKMKYKCVDELINMAENLV
ncbi:hypothetical protein M153_3100025879 [Pseudoloma neurophilia]|uniref:Uncharacterized protein n=1 Tax=Pseudoloma neurophilia TaxID=146866 RepID=A0A0R0MA00_9MICR|nr:hypothetical protein M153_3100025879 [Pseudoloma neurophilia]